jgi:hypothetical protein
VVFSHFANSEIVETELGACELFANCENGMELVGFWIKEYTEKWVKISGNIRLFAICIEK